MARLGLAVRLLPGCLGVSPPETGNHTTWLPRWDSGTTGIYPAKIYPGRVPEAETVPGRPTEI